MRGRRWPWTRRGLRPPPGKAGGASPQGHLRAPAAWAALALGPGRSGRPPAAVVAPTRAAACGVGGADRAPECPAQARVRGNAISFQPVSPSVSCSVASCAVRGTKTTFARPCAPTQPRSTPSPGGYFYPLFLAFGVDWILPEEEKEKEKEKKNKKKRESISVLKVGKTTLF